MPNPVAEATAYIEKLEAARRAAIEISGRKAEEAKLIAARQEGFPSRDEDFYRCHSGKISRVAVRGIRLPKEAPRYLRTDRT